MSPQDPPPDEGDETTEHLSGPAEETAEERAWREIVANYGERADLRDAEPPAAPAPGAGSEPVSPEPDDVPPEPLPEPEERFVPPTPPPLPRPTGLRAVAWAGVFVSPLLVLFALVVPVDLPSVLDLALVAWFVGGFVYLVATMKQSPPDPWDDGSRV